MTKGKTKLHTHTHTHDHVTGENNENRVKTGREEESATHVIQKPSSRLLFSFFFLNQLYELRGLSCISKGCGGTARLRCWAVAYLARSQPLFSTTEDISTYLIHTFLNISPTLVHIRLYSIKFIKVHS